MNIIVRFPSLVIQGLLLTVFLEESSEDLERVKAMKYAHKTHQNLSFCLQIASVCTLQEPSRCSCSLPPDPWQGEGSVPGLIPGVLGSKAASPQVPVQLSWGPLCFREGQPRAKADSNRAQTSTCSHPFPSLPALTGAWSVPQHGSCCVLSHRPRARPCPRFGAHSGLFFCLAFFYHPLPVISSNLLSVIWD